MEKVITINSVKYTPTKAGKDKYTIETIGEQFSVWDSALAEKLNKRIGTNVSVEIRPAVVGTNYLATITAMNDASDGTIKSEVEQGERALNGEAQPPVIIERGAPVVIKAIAAKQDQYRTPKEISAQTLTGFVVEIIKMQPNASSVAEIIESVLRIYKDFLKRL